MKNYKYIFVVVVYRNTNDLNDFLKNIKHKVESYKVIVVNSFFDKNTSLEFECISKNNGCDFIEVENKGYSFGNNVGIRYAREMYNFNYLIVSNADILIERFKNVYKSDEFIIAPNIINGRGQKQNPMILKDNGLAEKFKYIGFKKDNKILVYLGILILKVMSLPKKTSMFNNKKTSYEIYQPHGCFIIFGNKTLSKFGDNVFDDKMFLFAEESLLALKCKQKDIKIIYDSDYEIHHKEDGSMSFDLNNVYSNLKTSYIYFYENYYKKKGE